MLAFLRCLQLKRYLVQQSNWFKLLQYLNSNLIFDIKNNTYANLRKNVLVNLNQNAFIKKNLIDLANKGLFI